MDMGTQLLTGKMFSIDSGLGAIQGEIRSGSPMIIFSHGFGVKRDSRGLFTDIASSLPEKFGYILFDFSAVDGDNVYLRSYSEQVIALKSVISMAREISPNIYIVGHSMGAITVALLGDPLVSGALLLAPPVSQSSGRTYFTQYPGAFRDEQGVLVIPRKDRTITHVSDKFWDEAESINPVSALQDYGKKCPLTVVRAIDEDVLRHTENYTLLSNNQGIELLELPGNHTFDPPQRQGLISTIIDILVR